MNKQKAPTCIWDAEFLQNKLLRIELGSSKMADKIAFLSENPAEIRDRLPSITKDKEAGNENSSFYDEVAAMIDKLKEYTCITQTHYKCNLFKLI